MQILSMQVPWRIAAHVSESGEFRLLMKRNCSISPRGLFRVFLLLALLNLGIGVGFAIAGAWLILPFAGLEIALLGAAFLANGRHASDYERIEFAGGRLSVEIAEAARTRRCEFEADPRLVQLREDEGGIVGKAGCRLVLEAPGLQVELGRHLDAASRRAFAAELKKRLVIGQKGQ